MGISFGFCDLGGRQSHATPRAYHPSWFIPGQSSHEILKATSAADSCGLSGRRSSGTPPARRVLRGQSTSYSRLSRRAKTLRSPCNSYCAAGGPAVRRFSEQPTSYSRLFRRAKTLRSPYNSSCTPNARQLSAQPTSYSRLYRRAETLRSPVQFIFHSQCPAAQGTVYELFPAVPAGGNPPKPRTIRIVLPVVQRSDGSADPQPGGPAD